MLNVVGIEWGLPNDHAWNADDISPWKPLSLPWRYFEGFDKYPYLHWMLSLALYAPYLGWLALTGGLDPACLPSIVPEEACFADPFGAPSVLMWISRLLSAAMGVGCVAAVYALARELHPDRRAALFAALAAAVSGVLVAYAHLGNLDVPHCFWFAVSLVFYARLLRTGEARDFAGFGLAAGAALATKEGIVGAYVGIGAVVAVSQLRGAGIDRRVWLLVGCLVAVYALGTNPLLNPQGFVEHWKLWLPGGERMEGYRAEGFRGWGHFARLFAGQARGAVGAPLLGFGLVALVWASVRHPRTCILLAPALSYLALSLAGSSMTRVRFLLPLVILAAVHVGILAARLAAATGPRRALALSLLAFVFGHAFLHSVNIDLHYRRDARYAAEAWLLANLEPGARPAVWHEGSGLPRLRLHGFEPERLPREADPVTVLAERAPDVLVVSSSYPGPFPGSRRAALGRLRSGELGYRVVWEGQGTTPLDRWFENPFGWLNPKVVIFAPDATARRGR